MSVSDNFPDPTAETIKRPLVHYPGHTGGDILYASMSASEDAAQIDVIDQSGERSLWSGELDEANARALANALTALADQIATKRAGEATFQRAPAQGSMPRLQESLAALSEQVNSLTPEGGNENEAGIDPTGA